MIKHSSSISAPVLLFKAKNSLTEKRFTGTTHDEEFFSLDVVSYLPSTIQRHGHDRHFIFLRARKGPDVWSFIEAFSGGIADRRGEDDASIVQKTDGTA